jgi:hypothetical protein
MAFGKMMIRGRLFQHKTPVSDDYAFTGPSAHDRLTHSFTKGACRFSDARHQINVSCPILPVTGSDFR